MKKWILGLLGVFLLAVTSLTSSCRQNSFYEPDDDSYEYYDSVFIVKTVQNYVNGTFTNSVECCSFQTEMKEAAQIDSIFTHIEPYKLRDVANVLSNKLGTFSKKDVVQEYLRNSDIYDNLGVPVTQTNPTGNLTTANREAANPTPSNKEAANPTTANNANAGMEDQPVRRESGTTISSAVKDTVINGEQVTVETITKTTHYD